MPYLCESFMTIPARRSELCASRKVVAPIRQTDSGAAAPIRTTMRRMNVPSAPGDPSTLQLPRRYAATARHDGTTAKLEKLGDRM